MRIGVLFSLYNCMHYFDSCVNPWFDLKDKYDFVFATCSGVHQQMPKEAKKRANANNAYSLLKILGKDFDFIVSTMGKNNWTDEKSKNYMLNYLKDQNVDLIWIVDGDEIYTKTQIVNIIEFIESNTQYDIYTLNYKNHVFKKNLWIDDFHKRVIYWINRNEGIKEFIFDTDIKYNDDTLAIDSNHICRIDRNIAFIDHYTWLVNDCRTKDKLEYQNNKYYGTDGKRCGFKYTDAEGLIFNKDFYSERNLSLPTLHETITISSKSIKIIFNKDKAEITIKNFDLQGIHLVEIYDLDNNLLYQTNFDFVIDVDYYIIIYNDKFKNLEKFRIKICKNETIINDEYIYINLYERFFFN